MSEHSFPKGFVEAAFAAREKGLRAICVTCYTGFNETDCPVCHPPKESPELALTMCDALESWAIFKGHRFNTLAPPYSDYRFMDAIAVVRSALATPTGAPKESPENDV